MVVRFRCFCFRMKSKLRFIRSSYCFVSSTSVQLTAERTRTSTGTVYAGSRRYTVKSVHMRGVFLAGWVSRVMRFLSRHLFSRLRFLASFCSGVVNGRPCFSFCGLALSDVDSVDFADVIVRGKSGGT